MNSFLNRFIGIKLGYVNLALNKSSGFKFFDKGVFKKFVKFW